MRCLEVSKAELFKTLSYPFLLVLSVTPFYETSDVVGFALFGSARVASADQPRCFGLDVDFFFYVVWMSVDVPVRRSTALETHTGRM